jgi:hypothetical protein
MSAHHQHYVITDLDQVRVRLCGCGVVHMSMGPVAINLSPQALKGMSSLLSHLISELDAVPPNVVRLPTTK